MPSSRGEPEDVYDRARRLQDLADEAFVREGVSQGRRPDLVGGGLIRSLGGWSQVLCLRCKGIKVPYDERVLGSGGFLQHPLEEVEERERETLHLSKKVKDLDALAEEMARQEGLREEKLRSGSRARRISSARRLFCQLAVGELGYSGAQVARFLGVPARACPPARAGRPGSGTARGQGPHRG